MIEETAEETINIIEIKAGELILKVPHTSEGLKVVRAMVTLLEAEFVGEEKAKMPEKVGSTSKEGGAAPKLPTHFSPSITSTKQRIKYKNWEALATTGNGTTIYKEVVNRILEEYKEDLEPDIKTISQIIWEMYGKHLKETSIASYVSMYKRYIRENKLAEPHFTKEDYKKDAKNLRVIPIDKVVEIWSLLPPEFTYKQVKALIPVSIMQSRGRVDATNYTIREFKENPAFGCEEPSPGVFKKR